MKLCIATITSLNIAIKVQRALAREGIFSKIVSVDPRQTKRGCSNGIEFACGELSSVKRILRLLSIRNAQIIEKDGEW